MSLINFESSWTKAKDRQELRKVREAVLEKAEKKAKFREQIKEQEDSWILPSLDKKMKKKKKKKESSSTSSDSSEEDEWVEKKNEHIEKDSNMERQSWMQLGADVGTSSRRDPFALLGSTKDEQLDRRETAKQKERRLLEEKNAKLQSQRELNPNLNLKKQSNEQNVKIGDGGASWLRRAFKRAEEQAKAEGKSIEEVAEQRWGSLENFKKLLDKAEGRVETNERSSTDFRRRSPDRRHGRDREHSG